MWTSDDVLKTKTRYKVPNSVKMYNFLCQMVYSGPGAWQYIITQFNLRLFFLKFCKCPPKYSAVRDSVSSAGFRVDQRYVHICSESRSWLCTFKNGYSILRFMKNFCCETNTLVKSKQGVIHEQPPAQCNYRRFVLMTAGPDSNYHPIVLITSLTETQGMKREQKKENVVQNKRIWSTSSLELPPRRKKHDEPGLITQKCTLLGDGWGCAVPINICCHAAQTTRNT